MCIGGQDIPVTISVDGSVEDGQWKTSDDVNNVPTQEEVTVQETQETVEPSSTLYQPVIDRINTLSQTIKETLPEKTADKTAQEIHPMFMNVLDFQDRRFDSIDRRLPYRPRPPKWSGPFRRSTTRLEDISMYPRTGGIRPPTKDPNGTYSRNQGGLSALPSTISTPMQQVMQPPVIEEQVNQMEILGQPKQFRGGGIIDALMMTPIGQNEIRKLQEGGEIGGARTGGVSGEGDAASRGEGGLNSGNVGGSQGDGWGREAWGGGYAQGGFDPEGKRHGLGGRDHAEFAQRGPAPTGPSDTPADPGQDMDDDDMMDDRAMTAIGRLTLPDEEKNKREKELRANVTKTQTILDNMKQRQDKGNMVPDPAEFDKAKQNHAKAYAALNENMRDMGRGLRTAGQFMGDLGSLINASSLIIPGGAGRAASLIGLGIKATDKNRTDFGSQVVKDTMSFLGSGVGFEDTPGAGALDWQGRARGGQVGGISSLANGGLVDASKRFFEQTPSFSNQGVAIEETVITPRKPQGVLQSIKKTLDIDQPIEEVEEEVVLKKPMLPPVVQPSQQIGDAPETGNPTQQKLDGETLSNILGGIGGGLSLFTGGLSSLGGKAVSLFNQAFNPGSILNTIRGDLTGNDNKQDPNLNLGYSSHPHTVSTPGYDEVTGFEASDSVDIGGSDPGVDAMGQATGQEMGEEDDDNSMDGAWT